MSSISTTTSRRTNRESTGPAEEDETYYTGRRREANAVLPSVSSSSFSGGSIDTDDFESCRESGGGDEEPVVVVLPEGGSLSFQPLSPIPPTPEDWDDEDPERGLYSGTILRNPNHNDMLPEQLLLFGCGLGSSLCYIATLSSLVYFKLLYGAASFVYLNLAVYLPLLPISLAQAKWDRHYDSQYRSRRAYLVRGVVGFGLGLAGTLGMIDAQAAPRKEPLVSRTSDASLRWVVCYALIQGTGGAILYGTLNQLASFCGPGEDGPRRLKATVSAGVQASALVVLAVSLLTGFGVKQASKFPRFLWTVTGLEAICFAMFLWLILARPAVTDSLVRRDSTLQLEDLDADNEDEEEQDPYLTENNSYNGVLRSTMGTPLIPRRILSPNVVRELSYGEMFQKSAQCCSVLAITLVPSFLVGSWFTQVQTNWMALASWLFYVRIGCDFLGRLATIALPPRTIPFLLRLSFLRLVPVGFFFANAQGGLLPVLAQGPASDALSVGLVAIIAFLSGYLVTGCFQLAPLGIPLGIREANNLAKQASLLTVAFSVSAVGGLLSSFSLLALGV